MIQKATFSSREAAEYLGISYWLMLEMVKRGEINPIRAGGRYLFRQSGLDAWMDKQDLACEKVGMRGGEKKGDRANKKIRTRGTNSDSDRIT